MSESKIPYRLGLDVGANSIGWAALALDANGDPCGVLAMGSRIFSDGRTAKESESLAKGRRLARGQRRRRRRYLRRRASLLNALADYGLMPSDADERKKLAGRDPYALRKRALAGEPLTPHELGRALFHLNQRRGFKSNRKTGGGEDKKKATQARLDREGLRRALGDPQQPLGKFLAERREQRKPVRARPGQELYPERSMYVGEFNLIKTRQAKRHKITPTQWDALREIIFHQRPLKEVKPGWCALEANERRAPRAHPDAQEFRILEEVNNLRVTIPGQGERCLTHDERQRALGRLLKGVDIGLQPKPPEQLPQYLKLPEGAAFNLARGGRAKLKGDGTTARLKKKELFGEKWLKRDPDDRAAIAEFLIDAEDPEDVRKKAERDWGMNKEQARRLAMAELPAGYVRLSLKAIRKILPYLREGRRYDEAVVAAGYPHHSDFRNAEAHDRLPYYGVVLDRDVVGADPRAPETDEVKRWGRFPNPTVHVGLNQIRRVVNRIIEVYGKPEEIVVELARDLGMSAKQRRAHRKAQTENEKRNERYRKMLEGIRKTTEMFRKLRLWEEQEKVCVYSGSRLSLEMVVSEQTEIDHILPRSWSLDNSMANRVVCLASANKDKGDQTPHEAFFRVSDEESKYDYDAILKRANALPDNKKWRFGKDARQTFEEQGNFLDRHLNETAYLSRTARRYLAYLYNEKGDDGEKGEVRVRAIPGRLTAELRAGWGFAKRRDDHRHHAIDAFVAANTTQGLLQRFAQASKNGDDAVKLLAENPDLKPWPGFDPDAIKTRSSRIIVSHKQDHPPRPAKGGTTGRLHDATAYGLPEPPGDGPARVSIRKKLADFDAADLQAVRGKALKEALLPLWESVNGDAAEFARRAAEDGVLVAGRPRIVRKARIEEKQRVVAVADKKAGKAYKGYLRGGNEFADVWRLPDGDWRVVVVPTFEFNQPEFDEMRLRPHPEAKRLARIYKGDMAAVGEGDDRRIVRVRKIDNAKNGAVVYMDGHNEANVDKRIRQKELKEKKYSVRQLRANKFRKVGVDEIGRLRDPGPFREAVAPAAARKEPAKRERAAKPEPAESKPRQPSLL